MARRKKLARPKNYLREWREFRDMSQDELAALAKTDKSVISLIEGGHRGLTDRWAHTFAPLLKCRPGALFDYDPHTVPANVLDVWARVPDEDKPQALTILETFTRRRAP